MKRRVCRAVLAATGWAAVGYFMVRTVACRDNCEHRP